MILCRVQYLAVTGAVNTPRLHGTRATVALYISDYYIIQYLNLNFCVNETEHQFMKLRPIKTLIFVPLYQAEILKILII